ncbi:hypothetical protein GCM10009743_65900 [Kribbella swartbergensis]
MLDTSDLESRVRVEQAAAQLGGHGTSVDSWQSVDAVPVSRHRMPVNRKRALAGNGVYANHDGTGDAIDRQGLSTLGPDANSIQT